MITISNKLVERFHLAPMSAFSHSTRDWYWTFLLQSDYIVLKVAEAQALGEAIGDYKEILEARRYCREQINAIDNGTYTGPFTAGDEGEQNGE